MCVWCCVRVLAVHSCLLHRLTKQQAKEEETTIQQHHADKKPQTEKALLFGLDFFYFTFVGASPFSIFISYRLVIKNVIDQYSKSLVNKQTSFS
jgi:hypothetical protein